MNKLLYEHVLAIARGQALLSLSDLQEVAHNLDVQHISFEFLPGVKTITGTVSARKEEIFRLAGLIWGFSPDQWLVLEAGWQQSARDLIRSSATGGKDNLDDVVSAELLLRVVAAASLVSAYGPEDNADDLIAEVLTALNLAIVEAVQKGRTRMMHRDGDSVYGIMRKAGLMIGSGGGKYLPHPEASLPYLFSLLDRKVMNPAIYE